MPLRTFVHMCCAAAILSTGCFHGTTVNSARARHAARYGCAASEVEVETLTYDGLENYGTFAATGCGFRQVYFCGSNQCIGDGDPIRVSAPTE